MQWLLKLFTEIFQHLKYIFRIIFITVSRNFHIATKWKRKSNR